MNNLYDVLYFSEESDDVPVKLASGMAKSTADHLAKLECEKVGGVHHWVEPHQWKLSQTALEFEGVSGEDLETAERNAFEETRANGDNSQQWLARGFFNRPIGGDEYTIQTRSDGAAAYIPAFTDWREIMGQQESIADANRTDCGVM